ncbi:MAG TPA: hypothetical protein VK663_12390, partial [Burkholderiales bacterium]|nr:hypothetical protein [Burkholderiales bacterium]
TPAADASKKEAAPGERPKRDRGSAEGAGGETPNATKADAPATDAASGDGEPRKKGKGGRRKKDQPSE